ncbi:MAG TPA: hypothetical protein VFB34_02220 [Chloroflexota bacterium]|nr:hypothetical protein [Chloroflexota bacterium]
MNEGQVDAMIRDEVDHIPSGSEGQDAFRAIYEELRRNHLRGDSNSRRVLTLVDALTVYGEQFPEHPPKYDEDFFDGS